jgi:CheY-specific phosphatase CheX
LANVLGLHTTKDFFTFKSRNYNREAKVYATSACCSVATEGAIPLVSAVEGGMEVATAGVDKVRVKEAAAAVEGEIINTMAGVNFFAFSKKSFNSDQVQP